ncbi:beta-galactosidase [Herbidospora sp. RD11066]
MYFGGDYNPEQWPEHVWHEDVALMRRAKVNLVTLGVFSWSSLQPAPGRWEFGWLDRVIDLLHDNDIQVNLATPTASPPPWFGRKFPDTLTVTADGTRLSHGSRDTYCVSAPAYRAASKELAAALADRYGGHPALAMWHVHNEYGTWCHCDHVATAFRTWLRNRHGDLATLNERWTTAFWSQGYSDWDEILPPRATQWLPNPSQVLDFRRFLSDEMLAHFTEQRDLLRPTGKPITTNFAFGAWVPVDHWKWAREVDLLAIDDYPTGDLAEESAFAADLARSWAGEKPWILMEQAAAVEYTRDRTIPRPPGDLTRTTLIHIERGSIGALFFQWRASRGGAEQWHHGMLPHAGPDTRTFHEIIALGQTLATRGNTQPEPTKSPRPENQGPSAGSPNAGKPGVENSDPENPEAGEATQAQAAQWLPAKADTGEPESPQGANIEGQASTWLSASGTRKHPDVAIIWDDEAWWALQNRGLPSRDLDYLEAVKQPHRLLYRAGHHVAFAHPEHDLSPYRLVIVPSLLPITDRAMANLAACGGTVLMSYFSAVTDEHLRVRLGGHLPAFGITIKEHRPLAEPLTLSDGSEGSLWSEEIRLDGAEAIVTYPDGTPAVTRFGKAWYLSTRLADKAYEGLLTCLLRPSYDSSGTHGER